MVQIIRENRRPSFSESIRNSLENYVDPAIEKYQAMQQKQQQDTQRNQTLQQLTGIDMSGLPPEMQQAYMIEQLKGKNSQNLQDLKNQALPNKNQAEQFQDEKSYEKIGDTFGKKFADLWQAAPVGGKTELLKQGVEAKLRGIDLDQMLEGVPIPTQQESSMVDGQEPVIPQIENGKLPKDFQWPDFSKRPVGYTPKDWVEERKTWRKENADVFLQNKTSLKNSKRDSLDYKRLESLNPKLPKGFDKLIINPSTGEPYGPAQLIGKVPPEVQEWIKVISRFQNRAKDAYGSRVTNFDLQTYMKQYPSLLNTEEGRNRIIKMLQINNELDQSYDNALDKIYKKYGLGGIPLEEADKLAQSLIQDEVDRLSNEYLKIDEENQMSSLEKTDNGNQVEVLDQEGNVVGTIDASEVGDLPEGYRIR